MDKSLLYFFFGCLAIAMGFGSDQGEFIPSWAKLGIGVAAIGYGIYLKYGSKTMKGESQSSPNSISATTAKKARPSYAYLTVGVLLLSFSKYLSYENGYLWDFWTIAVWTAGFALCIYGLYLFFKERREKKESGNIE
ncbi:MAG: hypothetical protein AAFQ20_02660 [Bacteroidota bacterium]